MLSGFETKEKIKDDWGDKWEPNEDGKGFRFLCWGEE